MNLLTCNTSKWSRLKVETNVAMCLPFILFHVGLWCLSAGQATLWLSAGVYGTRTLINGIYHSQEQNKRKKASHCSILSTMSCVLYNYHVYWIFIFTVTKEPSAYSSPPAELEDQLWNILGNGSKLFQPPTHPSPNSSSRRYTLHYPLVTSYTHPRFFLLLLRLIS